MNKVRYFLLFMLLGQFAMADIPWQNIRSGNTYWAGILGLEPAAPTPVTAAPGISVVDVKADPAIQLLNAVLRYQIDELENKALARFADSMMHVMMYLSGASPAAVDGENRAGWWRLSYPVAMRYGLRIDAEVDERFDFERSTFVAMQYSRALVEEYGSDWLLAFVHSPVDCARPYAQQRREDLDIELTTIYNLMVTSNYTPAEAYAVTQFYSSVETYKADQLLLKALIYEHTGIQESTFKALNPALIGKYVPGQSTICLTKLAIENLEKNEEDVAMLSEWRMEEYTQKLAEARNRIVKNQPDPRTSKANYYKVKSGDNLGLIASRFGVNVSDIKSWNSLRGNTIYVGQKLVVYSKKTRTPKTTNTTVTASASSKKQAPQKTVEVKEGEFLTYKVKTGDTLYSIAKRFPGVSADNLMTWNGISPNIKVGQKIKVLKSEIRDYTTDKYPDSI